MVPQVGPYYKGDLFLLTDAAFPQMFLSTGLQLGPRGSTLHFTKVRVAGFFFFFLILLKNLLKKKLFLPLSHSLKPDDNSAILSLIVSH